MSIMDNDFDFGPTLEKSSLLKEDSNSLAHEECHYLNENSLTNSIGHNKLTVFEVEQPRKTHGCASQLLSDEGAGINRRIPEIKKVSEKEDSNEVTSTQLGGELPSLNVDSFQNDSTSSILANLRKCHQLGLVSLDGTTENMATEWEHISADTDQGKQLTQSCEQIQSRELQTANSVEKLKQMDFPEVEDSNQTTSSEFFDHFECEVSKLDKASLCISSSSSICLQMRHRLSTDSLSNSELTEISRSEVSTTSSSYLPPCCILDGRSLQSLTRQGSWWSELEYSASDECELSRIPKTVLEIFKSILRGRQIDIRKLAGTLCDFGIVSKDCLQCFGKIKESCHEREILILTDNINKNVTTLQLIYKMYNNNFPEVAQDLHSFYLSYAMKSRSKEVTRKIVGERRKIQIYFKQIKQNVHMLISSNPYAKVIEIGKQMLIEIQAETRPGRKRFLCDKYICLKAAEIDALTNQTDNVDPEGEPFKEIDAVIDESSCPEISLILMLGRQADISSSLGTSITDGEHFMTQAFQWQSICERCVEATDMMYKSVVLHLLQFQRSRDKVYQEKLFKLAKMGLDSLSEEDTDVRLFWSRLFRLRILYCHLGIGKRCEIIDGYTVTEESIKVVEKMLKEDKLENLEHRRKMMYGIAIARFFQLCGNIKKARDIINSTMNFAIEGNYSEKRNIADYRDFLNSFDEQENMSSSDEHEYLFNIVSPIYSRQTSRASESHTDTSEEIFMNPRIQITSISSGEYGDLTDSNGPMGGIPISPTMSSF